MENNFKIKFTRIIATTKLWLYVSSSRNGDICGKNYLLASLTSGVILKPPSSLGGRAWLKIHEADPS